MDTDKGATTIVGHSAMIQVDGTWYPLGKFHGSLVPGLECLGVTFAPKAEDVAPALDKIRRALLRNTIAAARLANGLSRRRPPKGGALARFNAMQRLGSRRAARQARREARRRLALS